MKDNRLIIGNLVARVPVVQGGMGVGVSLAGLASAVARAGGVGVISTAQIGFRDPDFNRAPIECNLKAIKTEIEKARSMAEGGIIGVNIMVATKRYEDYIKAAVDAKVDIIISGAGLPMNLPELVAGSNVKIAPIVSSRKAFEVLTKYWLKKYDRIPDMVVIEGPRAGGHLGFTREELEVFTVESYDAEIVNIIEAVCDLGDARGVHIPVVVAGGVYERADLERYLSLGADGVQMATRFVTTVECDASDAYKQTYINATKDDIVIIKSPVGMPGRAIHNDFIDRVASGERFMKGCRQCVKTCHPDNTPYCITEALINAVEGRVNEGLLFCGTNAYRADHIENVADIMEEFA